MPDTKACNLTEEEIKHLIGMHGCNLGNTDNDDRIERINYLNKRLKAFKEEVPKQETGTAPVSTAVNTGAWPTNG